MCDFKPGDEVVCVAGSIWHANPRWMFWSRLRPSKTLRKGQVYVIESVFWGFCRINKREMAGVTLKGVKGTWGAALFRKVQRRDLSAWLKTSAGNTDKLDKRQKKGVRA